jgi:hypothetical protein
MNTDRLPLVALGGALAERFGRGVRYPTVLKAIYAGYVPAQQAANGRWTIACADLDQIRRHFELDQKDN